MSPLSYIGLALILEFLTLISSTPTLDSFPRRDHGLQLDVDSAIRTQLQKPGYGGNPNVACKVLQQVLPQNDSVTSASGSAYTSLYEENWSTACWLKPACIVTPENTVQVSHVMKVLSAFNTRFAIRSGGHQYNPGFAGVGSNGVLIALSKLKSVSLSQDKSIATVGPGLRWGDVYAAIEPQGKVVVGGRISLVGVGGLILGGGHSHISNQYGLASDNVARFEVVLADGSSVNATRTNNQDLFWALKGGSTNFGVVTAFDLETHSFNKMFFETKLYALEHASDILRALVEFQRVGQLDKKSNIITQFLTNQVLILFTYAEPAYQPSAFSSFSEIPSTAYTLPPTNGTLEALTVGATGGLPKNPERWHSQTFSHKVDANFSIEAYNIYLEESAKAPANCTGEFLVQVIAKSLIEFGTQQGGNVFGLEDIPQQWLDISFYWINAADDAKVYQILETIISRITQAAIARGLNLPFLFPNNAGHEQAVLQSFGADNVQRLKAVAAKYDPKRVFQRLQNDGYLLSRVS